MEECRGNDRRGKKRSLNKIKSKKSLNKMFSFQVKEYLKDVKVCGARELRCLMRWRKSMRAILDEERAKLT